MDSLLTSSVNSRSWASRALFMHDARYILYAYSRRWVQRLSQYNSDYYRSIRSQHGCFTANISISFRRNEAYGHSCPWWVECSMSQLALTVRLVL